MDYMLDTNICIYIIKQRSQQIIDRLRDCEVGDVGLSTIVLSELIFGVEKSDQRQRNRTALTQFVAPLEIAPYDGSAAQAYGRIRALLEKGGTPIGPLDTLIAAHALSLNCTLVTNNERELTRVPGLQVENWAG